MKISQYGTLTTPLASDVVPVVDVNDTTMAASGTTKKITVANLRPGRLIYLDDYGADPTGTAFSDTALAAAQTAGGAGAYQIMQSANAQYKFANSYNFGRLQGFQGPGSALTTNVYTGSGTFLNVFDPSFSSSSSIGGQFGGFALNGYSSGTGAVGIRWGDLNRARCHDIQVSGFNTTGGKGIYFHNVSGWSEQAEWTAINLVDCSTLAYFDKNSFDYSVYQFLMVANNNQDGVRLENAAILAGPRFEVRGNFSGGAANTGAVIVTDRLNTSTGTSSFSQALFDVVVECDGGTGLGHFAILQKGGSPSSQFNGYGALVFTPLTLAFQNASFTGSYGFAGNIQIPGLGYMDTTDALVAQGGSQWYQSGNTSSNFAYNGMLIYPGNGDFQAFILPNGAITVGGFNGTNYARTRRIEIMFKQPSSGAAGTITWPASIKWAGGTHALSAANNAIDKVRLTYYPGDSTWYGEVILAYA